jgi:hypothetical protein
MAVVSALQSEERRLRQIILCLKASPAGEVSKILEGVTLPSEPNSDEGQIVHVANRPLRKSRIPSMDQGRLTIEEESSRSPKGAISYNTADAEEQNLDVSPFYSVNDMGHLDSFGPSSALQSSPRPQMSDDSTAIEHIQNRLITNAVLERQREHELRLRTDIDGVPIDLAMHLLGLHWSRQHYTFLLTYRPAIMRDLRQGGPHCSVFLINAIFACSSKFSRRLEVRDNVEDPRSAGARFFRRCDDLLSKHGLLMAPSVPTVVGLLLLGATFNARGETSKGWLYMGYALRMIYDLGLHLDLKPTWENAEEVEIRRRVFWGAFVCDKLQSLYLGRPIAIHPRDAHVSRQFMDTIEEKEQWAPYTDPMFPETLTNTEHASQPCILSVSTFQQLCLLSQIMTRIINKFYVVGATAVNARANLQAIDDSLDAWKKDLPGDLSYDPSEASQPNSGKPPPNLLHLHGIYYSLIILLHRPLLVDGHLRNAVAPASSWRRCSEAARNITSIALRYQAMYSFRGGPYLLAYALYVACTIHVRNAAALKFQQGEDNSSLLAASLGCLDELTIPNPGVSRPASIIRKLVAASGLNPISETSIRPQPLWDFDVDAILRMFPSEDQDQNSHDYLEPDITRNTSGFQHTLNEDVLYGFMDGQTLLYDADPPFLGMQQR